MCDHIIIDEMIKMPAEALTLVKERNMYKTSR